ncbi:hypothetical protein [uncultured Nocardioides sp.]|uniref:hypothetical protein n=1 Tax=uncultured Nocardioides sp. TaxID=198441 RepID=UPI0026122F1C|nr:hypothetical protein [uncultured Nocardioides sp.]
MSKESAQRAVRDARNAERLANGSRGIPARRFGQPAAPPARPSAPRGTRPPVAPPAEPAKTAAPAEAAATPAAEAETEELCGHKSMNGRTCTREKGHSAKNHRYS